MKHRALGWGMRRQLVALLLASSGCATLDYRGHGKARDQKPFPATWANCKVIGHVLSEGHEASAFIVFTNVVDLPFSLLFDTVLLPYDLVDRILYENDDG